MFQIFFLLSLNLNMSILGDNVPVLVVGKNREVVLQRSPRLTGREFSHLGMNHRVVGTLVSRRIY